MAMHPEEFQLSNGLPVIFQHFDGLVAATYWWIRVGSADEEPRQAGYAHFLEHMLFKDAGAKETGKASTGQMALAIESLGGDINAYTSFDQTVYHVTCAAQHWERILDSFGAMAKPQKFLKQDFEREREVILEELRKNEDSPGRQLFQSLLSTTFKKHPYGRPVIGTVKTLKAATVSSLEAFYKRHYVSGNMGLVLVGPIEDGTGERRKKLIQLLEKRFGGKTIPRKAAQPFKRPVEPPLRSKPEWAKRTFDVKTPTLAISFRAPDLKHGDVPALDLAANVLAMGESSRLYQSLFYQKSLVTDVSGGLYVPNDPGLLYFQAEMTDLSKVYSIAELLFAEIIRLQKEGPTEEELERVVTNAESDRLYSTQTADGMAGRLGFLRFGMGDLSYDHRYLEEIHAIDSERIKTVLKEYLVPERMSAALLLPKSSTDSEALDPARLEKILKEALSGVERRARSSKGKGPASRTQAELLTLPSGMKVVYHPRLDSHVMSVQAAALGGLRLELADPVDSADQDWGSSHLLSMTWTKGTRLRSSRQIAALVEGSAASLDGFAGRNTLGLQLTGLARDWSKLSAIYSEVLVDAAFPEDEVAHSRRVTEDSIRSLEDHSSQLCSKLFLETLFEKHPYGRMTIGSLDSVAQIDSEKLKKFHSRWIRPEHLVLSVVGAVKRPELDRWLAELERLFRSKSGQSARKTEVAPESPLKAPRWVEKKLGREQVHIIVGGLGSTLDGEDRFALRLLQTILGGQSGRLFIELREKKSLAYTVAPVSFEGMEPGYIGTYIACSPGKREEAVQGIHTVLERLASKGPTASEIRRAQEFFLGRRAMELQSDSSLASHYVLKSVYGLPLSEDAEVEARVRKVSARQIQDVCHKYLVAPPMVTSVVG